MISRKLEYKKYFNFNEVSKIENYDKAINDTTQIWHCHHRLETHTTEGEIRLVELSAAELKAFDMYYNRPVDEFIFLTPEEHIKIHKQKYIVDDKRKELISLRTKEAMNDSEVRRKISEALKGKPAFNKGKCLPQKQRDKVDKCKKAYKESGRKDWNTFQKEYYLSRGYEND